MPHKTPPQRELLGLEGHREKGYGVVHKDRQVGTGNGKGGRSLLPRAIREAVEL